jgi:hypothetical protein
VYKVCKSTYTSCSTSTTSTAGLLSQLQTILGNGNLATGSGLLSNVLSGLGLGGLAAILQNLGGSNVLSLVSGGTTGSTGLLSGLGGSGGLGGTLAGLFSGLL